MSASVKRRFIRQNREIARVNSTQSLRIRNLETEISRLLGENISLREQAINSAQEAERWRSSHNLIKEVVHLKDKLESRLSEVSALVTELGSLPEKAGRRSSHRRRSGIPEPVRSPDEKDWKNRQTIGGVIAGERELQEGRLPPIHEDKYYPRRTLEGHEIQQLVGEDAEASESPDLGPPPVAHFDVPDPIKFEPRRPLADNRTLPIDEEEVMVDSTNLETRRKRRVSSLLRKVSDLQEDPSNAMTESQDFANSLKPGSKRKLGAREEDEKAEPKSSDDFSFQRKSAISNTPLPRANSSRFTRAPGKSVVQPANEQSVSSPEKKDHPVRKVLAPKSTNSPTKVRRANINDKIAALKDEVAKNATARTFRQDRRRSIAPIQTVVQPDNPLENPPYQDLVEQADTGDQAPGLPPKTPAGLDLFSPTSTEPSARSNAQPTEIAVSASVEDVLGNAARGSRRARAAVSYAEPNLRDKMRRPGKELVTAVEGIDQFKNREASVRAESVDQHVDGDGVKKEQLADDPAWKRLPQSKDEPTSPLSNKVARLSGESKDITDVEDRPRLEPLSIVSGISKLSIYDGPTSSPHDGLENTASSPHEAENASEEPKKPNLKSRRHSVNPVGLNRFGQEAAASHNVSTERPPRPSSAAGHRTEGAGSRPSSAAGYRAEAPRPGSAADFRRPASVANETSKTSRAAADLKRSTSSASLGDAGGRTERAASRRRSMMV